MVAAIPMRIEWMWRDAVDSWGESWDAAQGHPRAGFRRFAAAACSRSRLAEPLPCGPSRDWGMSDN